MVPPRNLYQVIKVSSKKTHTEITELERRLLFGSGVACFLAGVKTIQFSAWGSAQRWAWGIMKMLGSD